MSTLDFALVLLVAVLQCAFMFLKMSQWPRILRILTGLPETTGQQTVAVGATMGLYNGFLAVALLISLFAGVSEETARVLQLHALACVALAGAFGAIALRTNIPVTIQTLPAAAAFLAVA